MPALVLTSVEMVDRIASNLADTRKIFVTEDNIYAYMNTAILVASIATRSISTKFYTFDTTTGSYEFNLPRDAIRGDPAFNVLFDGIPLAPVQWAESKEKDYSSDTYGKPVSWSMRMNKIVIYPPVSSEWAGKRLDVHCGQLADKVDKENPDQIIPLPTEMYPFMEEFCTALGWKKRHKTGRYKAALDLAMFHLSELKKISENIHREAPVRMISEQELTRRSWDIRSDSRYTEGE